MSQSLPIISVKQLLILIVSTNQILVIFPKKDICSFTVLLLYMADIWLVTWLISNVLKSSPWWSVPVTHHICFQKTINNHFLTWTLTHHHCDTTKSLFTIDSNNQSLITMISPKKVIHHICLPFINQYFSLPLVAHTQLFLLSVVQLTIKTTWRDLSHPHYSQTFTIQSLITIVDSGCGLDCGLLISEWFREKRW